MAYLELVVQAPGVGPAAGPMDRPSRPASSGAALLADAYLDGVLVEPSPMLGLAGGFGVDNVSNVDAERSAEYFDVQAPATGLSVGNVLVPCRSGVCGSGGVGGLLRAIPGRDDGRASPLDVSMASWFSVERFADEELDVHVAAGVATG